MPNGMLAKREGRKIGKVVGGRGLGDRRVGEDLGRLGGFVWK